MHPNSTQTPVLCPSSQLRQFECYICKKEFTTKRPMQDHYHKQHTQPPVKRCFICNDELPSKQSKHHTCHDLNLDCEYCSMAFESLYELKMHLMDDHEDQLIYICDICHRPFEMRSFMDHHKAKHPRGGYSCKRCPEIFDTKNQLRQHMRILHTAPSCKCDLLIFSEKFNIEWSYKFRFFFCVAHLCELCGKSFQTAEYLKKHKRTHSTETFKCSKCAFTTNNRSNLVVHVHRNHKNPTASYSCDICGKTMATSQALLKHIREYFYCVWLIKILFRLLNSNIH